jgi:phospholipase/lecithinase/hemolysin
LFNTFGSLLSSGVTKLFVPNLPDLGSISEFRNSPNQVTATVLTQMWNSNLLLRLFSLNNSTMADIFFFDVFSLLDGLLNNPASEGFTNTSAQCRSVTLVIFENECNHPETFVFWDQIHPTTAAHAVLGKEVFRLVSSGSVLAKEVTAPAVFMLFALGLMGLAFTRKSK